MSGYKTHILFYLTVVAALFYTLYSLRLYQRFGLGELSSVAVGAIYALAPDIDSPSSKIRAFYTRMTAAGILVLSAVNLLYKLPYCMYALAALSAVLLLTWFTRHRGFMHTPAAGAVLSAPLVVIEPLYAAMAFLGYATHLLLDGKLI